MRHRKKYQPEPTTEGTFFRAYNDEQVNYIRAIAENTVTICTGIAGSGKSMVAIGYAAEAIRQDKFKRILISRPVVAAGENFGALPGSISEKIHPFFKPAYDYFQYFLGPTLFNKLFFNKTITFEPVELLRGCTFDDTLMILDEGQNCTIQQYKLFLSRFGHRSKVIINGDPDQCDIKDSGLSHVVMKLEGMEDVALIRLNQVLRNDLIGRILRRI